MNITPKKKFPDRYRKMLVILAGLFISLAASAQVTITGNVSDTEGESIIGANVIIKGTTNGMVSDYDGNFTIENVNVSTDILVVSYLGYTTQEIPCNGRTSFKITLEEDNKVLEEVVIIGYGQVRKGDATGSMTSIKADASTRGFAPNAQDMLTGKIAGVNITSGNGSPTSGATIRIRGGSSLSASNDPLIIVDGVPLDNSGIGGVGNMLSTINPTDIETYTVLKDASATAIYGSRASNGVILITTKKGVSGKPKITYDGNVSYNIRTSKNKIDVLTGDEFSSFVKDAYKNEANYDEAVSLLGNDNTDWQDEIFRNTFNTEHNLSVYGSIKNAVPYRFSGGYTNINGILKTSGMERFTGSFSLSPTLFDKHLSLNLNGKGMHIKNRFASTEAIGAAIAMDPSKPLYDQYSPFDGYYTWRNADGEFIGQATKNPLAILEMTDDSSKANNFIGNFQADYKLHFLPDLRFNLNLGIDYSKSSGGKYISDYAPMLFNEGGYDGNWEQKRRNSLIDFYTQYGRNFNFLSSKFDIMAGYSWQHYWREGNNHDYRISRFDKNGNPEVVSINQYETEYYLVSFFGRLNYSIMDKYLITATLRNDGSSRFYGDNQWGLFPSVAFAWRIINEQFMQNASFVSDAKVRLGWGITGQQDINAGDYPGLARYEYGVGDQASYIRGYEGSDGVWMSLIRPESYNRDLKWESTSTYNAGIDYGFLKNRINGSVDFYYRKTTDLINAEAKAPAGTNFSEYVVANIGDLENTGIEFSINTTPVEKKDFKWEVGANFAYNKNKITKLSMGDNASAYRRYGSTKEGDAGSMNLLVHSVNNPAGMFYVYEQVYDENGKPIEGLYVDQNNDGQITEDDLRPYKKPTPDWTFGANMRFVWKAFDLSIAGHGSIGNYNYNGVAANSAGLSIAEVLSSSKFLSNRTQSAFDSGFANKQLLSDYYIQDASFFRIDNITLGWSFKNAKTVPFDGRLYFSVQNPFVFTKYKGLDPEVLGGADNDFYPRPLILMLGVNLNF